jgi:hypothetical protein
MADRWTEAMLDGDFEHAWKICDRVVRRRGGQSCADLPYHLRWVWDGAPLAGREVLVRCYHGLGDTLQFVRFVPRLAGIARRVEVEVQPALLPLLRGIAGVVALHPLGAAPPRPDAAVESMELPHALRIGLGELPGAIPYLAPPPFSPVRAQPAATPCRLRVGIVWAAGDWRCERSLPPQLLMPLTGLPLDLFCLQVGPARRHPGAAGMLRSCVAALSEDASILDTTRLLGDLDLVITVDTMVAHLAGALGRPVWTLLDADADWRWMRGRCDSPWYPTMRLFRQQRAGVWEPVIAELTAALARSAAMRVLGTGVDVALFRTKDFANDGADDGAGRHPGQNHNRSQRDS